MRPNTRPTLLRPLALALLFTACQSKSSEDAEGAGGSDEAPTAEPSEAVPPSSPRPSDVPGSTKLGPSGPAVLLGRAATGADLEAIAARDDRESLLVAIDTPYQIFEGQGTYVHVAAWHPDGKPAENASVFANGIEVGRTDRTGTLVFLYPPPQGGEEEDSSALGKGTITVAVDDRCGQVPFSPHARTPSFASDHLYVYTDRGAYRPGETIHVRSLGWHLEEDYAPLEGAEIGFTLRVLGGETIAVAKQTTDPFGVTTVDLSIPKTAPEGLYELEVAYGQERQSTRLQVKDFEPPTFRVEHTLGRFITADQTTLDFEVTVHPGSGSPFEGGKISLSAQASGRERVKITRAVTGSGPHAFALDAAQLGKLKGALGEGEFAKLVLEIEDSAGRRDTVDREMRFTKNPYVAVIEADKDQYTTDDPVEIVVKLSDLDGAPIRARKLTLEAGGETLVSTTDAKGMARFTLKMPGSNLDVAVHIEGVADPIARSTLVWSVPRPMRSQVAEPIIREGGEAKIVVRFPIDVRPAETVVHMDVVDTSGALVDAVLLPVEEEDGAPVARGSFRAPSWGSMLLTFFTLGRKVDATGSPTAESLGLLVEGQNLVVQPDRELQIVLDGLPETARPGSRLGVDAVVRDKAGNPVAFAMGAAVVDQRVLALKDPLEITPMDRFYNPELRTMSITGSKMLTWPVVSRNWGAHQRDIALPPFPYKEGGAIRACRLGPTDDDAGGFGFGIIGTGKGGGGTGFRLKSTDKAKRAAAAPGAPPPPPAAEPAAAAEEKPAGEAGEDRRSRARGPAAPTPVEITVRTRLPETSLWAPLLQGEGSVRIEGDLPETTGPQELIVVASDKRGGVGVARKAIRLDLPLFAEIDFPERLPAGAQVFLPVTVHNRTKASGTFEVSLALSGMSSKASVTVADGAEQVVDLPVTPKEAGTLEYTLTTRGSAHEDVMKGTVEVAPAGVPRRETASTVLSSGSAQQHFTIPASDVGNEVFARVGFPAVTTAFAEAEALAARVTDSPFSLATDLLTAVLVLRHAEKHGLTSPALNRLRKRAMAAFAGMSGQQHASGAFSYWRSGKPSHYVTGYVLQALIHGRSLGLATDDRLIQKAADFLARPLATGGTLSLDAIAFWEGDHATARDGHTADIFAILTTLPHELRSEVVTRALKKQSARWKAYLEGTTLDPLAAGRALEGLLRMRAISPSDAAAVARRLLEVRDHGHWEPTWFHAYGGTIEATAAVLLALHEVDPHGFVAEKRDTLRWILSTRDSWGVWHNERGSAAVIAAILAVGSPPDEKPSTVTVRLDGSVVRTVHIDPADPFASASELTHLFVGRNLAPGEHRVEVEYDGTLAPSFDLVTTHFVGSASGTAEASGHRITAALDRTTATVGDTVFVTVDLALGPEGVATLLVGPSAGLELDYAALERLVENRSAITDYRITEHGTSVLVDPSRRATKLRLPFVARRASEAPLDLGLRLVAPGSDQTLGVKTEVLRITR